MSNPLVNELRQLYVCHPDDGSTSRYEPYVLMSETMRDKLAALIEEMEKDLDCPVCGAQLSKTIRLSNATVKDAEK